MSQPGRRERGGFWAGVTGASGQEREMPPRMGRRHRATHRGGVGRPPLYLELTRTHVLCHMEGPGGSSPGTQFCCKAAGFFSGMCPVIIFSASYFVLECSRSAML